MGEYFWTKKGVSITDKDLKIYIYDNATGIASLNYKIYNDKLLPRVDDIPATTQGCENYDTEVSN